MAVAYLYFVFVCLIFMPHGGWSASAFQLAYLLLVASVGASAHAPCPLSERGLVRACAIRRIHGGRAGAVGLFPTTQVRGWGRMTSPAGDLKRLLACVHWVSPKQASS